MVRFPSTTSLLLLKDVHVLVHIVISTMEEKNLYVLEKTLKTITKATPCL